MLKIAMIGNKEVLIVTRFSDNFATLLTVLASLYFFSILFMNPTVDALIQGWMIYL